MLVTSYGLSHLTLHATLYGRCYHHPFFTNEKNKQTNNKTQLSESHKSNGLQSEAINQSPVFDQHVFLFKNGQNANIKLSQS